MTHRLRLRLALLILATVTLGLTACNTGAGDNTAPGYSADEAAAAITGAQGDTAAIVSGTFDGNAGLAVRALPAWMPTPVAPGTLPTGVYQWSATSHAWAPVSASVDLVLQWSFQDAGGGSHDAVLTIDWAVGASTVTVDDGGSNREVPQDALATLEVDGTEVGRLAAQVGWQDVPGCGPILEPATLDMSGHLGTAAHQLSIDRLSLSIPVTNGTLASSGEVSGVHGSHTLSVDWDVSLIGSLTRAAGTCAVTDGSVTSGHFGLGWTSTSHDVHLAFDFDTIVRDGAGALQSVDLANGMLRIDGVVAATFQGTLDDANANHVPGDDLILTFKDGQTMTLEAFLQTHLGTLAAFASFGRVGIPSLP
jgi:hypothetical protein